MKLKSTDKKALLEETIDRRKFLGAARLVGVGVALASQIPSAFAGDKPAEEAAEKFDYTQNDAENMIWTVCLGCNTGCPIKVKIQNGAAVKIDGNPYTPWCKVPHIPYKTPVAEAAKIDGSICPKGQAGFMTSYDPFRIKKVLKRDGARGSMKWKTIDFHQAIDEIVNGGNLFSHISGEENRKVEGLKDIIVKGDKTVIEEMAKAVDVIWNEAKTPEEKKAKVEEFKETFKDHLHLLIDPNHPDFGLKTNQFVWTHGRLKGGRSDFFGRFVKDAIGTVNWHGHTTVCQGSLYFTGKAMSEQFGFDEKKKKATWHSGQKFFWQADQNSSEFIIFVGTSPFEANYPPLRTTNIQIGVTSGRLKYAVADPRLSKTAAQAWKWLPIKPGGEGAFALAMIRWILENEKFDRKYLENANKAASNEDKEPTYTNACWLVKMKDGKGGAFLRASDIGLPKVKKSAIVKGKDGAEEKVDYEFDPFVVMWEGKPVPFDNDAVDENDKTKYIAHGELFVDTTIKDVQVKSVFTLLKEEATKHTIEEWAALCGLKADDIIELSKEFTSHGKKAVFDMHRGVSQHTNGFYNCFAGNTLNLLIGNYDWRGGSVIAASYNTDGSKAGTPYNFAKGMTNGKANSFGLGILRNLDYEKSTLFDGKYPAQRPWFPHATDVYQEILPSISDAYPYPIKAWLLYLGTPGYALPAGQTQIAVLADTKKLPLFIASDIMIGGSSMYADYIIPDLTFHERWEFQGSHPNNIWKVQPVRNPAIASPNEIVKVFGEEMPISLEAFMLAVAEKMKLKGFGKDGLGEGMDFNRPEDFYLKMIANIGFGEKPDGSDAVPDADDNEVRIFEEARRHLPKDVFDMEKWKKAAGEHWKKVVYVMNRGGRYQDYEKAFDGKLVKNKYGKMVNMYSEKVAKSKNSMTGKSLKGLATYLPMADSIGNPIASKEGDLLLITHREIFHTKARTAGNKLLRELEPENFILINTIDAKKLGFRNGDYARVVSDSNPEGVWVLPNFGKKHMVGKVKVIEGMRPGVISFSLGHGHWAQGAADVTIDGQVIKGDPERGRGIHANAAMMIDPHLKNICLQDLVGGSVSFYDSPVRLVKETKMKKETLEIIV